MKAGALTHWAAALAVVAGLLLMRLPSLACRCDTSACCVLTPQMTIQPAADSLSHESCCPRCAPHGAEDSRPHKNDSGKDRKDDPAGCDCGCNLCKTTNPTPLHAPASGEPSDILTGTTLDLLTAAAPEADRITLLRPPRL